jgi:hypothetical protein
MKLVVTCPLLLAVSALLVSCAGEAERDQARPTEHKSFSQRLNDSNGYKQDPSGNWVPKSDKRSSFESVGASPYFKGNAKKKEFNTEEYRKKSWWGSRDFKMQAYQGNTDGSRFQTTARQQGAAARENRSAADLPGAYATDRFATGAAREAGVDGVSRMEDAETEARRRVYQAPEVLNWREQRPITREQTKSLLGR